MKPQTRAQQKRQKLRRKRLVAELLVTQQASSLTYDEIAEAIAYPRNSRGRVNKAKACTAPNGKPWSYKTIEKDVHEIEARWRNESLTAAATWKSRIIAQYQELLERYWRSGEYEGVERVLAALRKTIGTDSDQVVLFEQMQLQMAIAAQRLKAGLAEEPELANRAFRLLTGNPNANVFAVPDPQLAPRTITLDDDDEADE